MAAIQTEPTPLDVSAAAPAPVARVTSIDALRGLIMLTMIFVNDLAGVSHKLVPNWMRHYEGKNGMTFVDLVFPAFLFIVGMSIPFALGGRIAKGESPWKTLRHIVLRTLSLLLIGVIMVNESPGGEKMGWSPALWTALMFLAAIFTFCTIAPPRGKNSESRRKVSGMISAALQAAGFIALLALAFAFRGEDDHRIIQLSPFSIHTEWWGILGLIGWAYCVSAMIFLLFCTRRTALLACVALLYCLYPADRKGAFDGWWVGNIVGIGETLGSQAAITVAGLLLATILITPDTAPARERVRFSLWFIAACSAGAWLLQGLYGISKNNATPSWCLWACAVTAGLWLLFYLICDVWKIKALGRPFAVAGQNVLLAYLLSEMMGSVLELIRLDGWYGHLASAGLMHAVARSLGCGIVILALAAGLNRAGFRVRL